MKGKKRNNAVGLKGRSGRKSLREEFLKMNVINKAWAMKDEKMSEQDATQIVLKDMGNKIIGDKDQPLVLQITGMEIIEDNENPIQNKEQETDTGN